jgi:PKD repeat protein
MDTNLHGWKSAIFIGIFLICTTSLVTTSAETGNTIQTDQGGGTALLPPDFSGPDSGLIFTGQDSRTYTENQDDTEIITTYPVKPMAGGNITFTLSGTYPSGTLFNWTFGDGISRNSGLPTIEHRFDKTGIYLVSVVAYSGISASKTVDLTMQKGDILVHAGEGIISALIPGEWSHAGMYIGNDTILESTEKGVHISNISIWSFPQDTCVGVFRLLNITNQTRDNIVHWALGKKQLPYDLWSILLYTKQIDCQSLMGEPLCNRYYCSELVWAAYLRNEIDLDPIFGAVLPRTVVTGKYQTTELVGAHIEKIPAAFKHYQKYYDQILQGKNPPYVEGTIADDTNYHLIILGSTEDNISYSGFNMTPDSNIHPEYPSPEVLEMHIVDPHGRGLSKIHTTIPNSSIGNVDLDGDGIFSDEMAGLFNPVPGEYVLNIPVANQTRSFKPFSLIIGAWDSDQYEWVTPYNKMPIHLVHRPVQFRIDKEEFSRTITIPCRGPAPLNVSFIELSLLDTVNNTWYFGDGTTVSDMMTTSHLYTVPGTYIVRLVSLNNENVSRISIPVVVEEMPVPLDANFTADPVTGTPPLTVQFSDISSGEPVSWNWTFGDGIISHEQSPVHTYSGIGIYTITLEITNKTGSQSVMRKSRYITTNSGRITGPNGMIWISSSPSDALIYMDRVFIGATPLRSSGIPAGVHQIRVKKDGYKDWVGYVQINQGVYTYVPKVILQKN